MRCLVLGGTGFIGSHLVDALVDAKHEVYLMSRYPNPHWSPQPQVKCLWADWRDAEQLGRVVSRVDVVVHLIGTTTPATSNADMAADVTDNLLPTLSLLKLCRQYGVRKIVFASSGGTVYGVPTQIPINEHHPGHPISSYGVTKLAIEEYLQLHYHLYGLNYIIIRPSNTYGERQNLNRPQGAVGIFMNLMLQSKPIEVWGNGQVVRDYIYVRDLALAFQSAIESPLDHGVFNAGSGEGLSLLELLEELKAVTGLSPLKLISQLVTLMCQQTS